MVRQRNPGLVVLFSILSLGIYGIIVSVKMAKEVDQERNSRAAPAMVAGLWLWIAGILAIVVGSLLLLAGGVSAVVEVLTTGEVSTGAAMIYVAVALLLSTLVIHTGMAVLFAAGHVRLQAAATGSGGAALGLGVGAVVLMTGGNLWVVPGVPEWVRYLGGVSSVLVLIVLAMSASAANRLASGGATGGVDAGAAAAW